MSTSFWMKCGHLLTDGGSLVKCRTCPCGYYGLFAFVARPFQGPDGDPTPCSGTQISVMPCEIIDGKINYLGDMGIMWSGCIQINMQADSKGRVGHAKGCTSSWEECVEWDQQTWDCLETETVYQGCYEIDVYRIGSCYENLEDFKAYVYSKCPQITPPYPNLWQYWYGNRYTSQEAEQCIYKDWDVNQDSWYSYAYFRWYLKANFHWQRYDCNIRIDTNTQIGHEEETGRYYWCDGECREYDQDYNCIDCDGTLQEQIMYDWVTDANAHYIEKPAWGGSRVYTYSWALCEWQQGDPECKCIDWDNANAAAGISSINSEAESILSDKSQYWVGEDTTTGGLCLNKSYSSRFQPNQCWASWWIQGINRKWCYYGKLTIEKWDNRVQYSGVKIKLSATKVDGAGTGGNPQRYPLSVNHQTTVLYDETIIEATWGTQIEFPMVNNMIAFSIYDAGHCVNWGDYSTIRFYPYDSACENCSTVNLSVEVIDYIR